jgi:hypothetical protein
MLPRRYALPVLAILSVASIFSLADTVGGSDRGEESDVSEECPFMSPLNGRDGFVVTSQTPSDLVSSATIISNFRGAWYARYGNTPEELQNKAWESYTSRRLWYLPGYNYPVRRQVYAEFRNWYLTKISAVLPVYPCVDTRDGGDFPMVEVPDSRISEKIWSDDFEQEDGRWVSYMDAYGYGNVFFPLTYEAVGGIDGGGYSWSDSSRWNIDAPEKPDSTLVAMIYWRWLFAPSWRARSGLGDFVDLEDVTVSVELRGKKLDLKGAYASFWVLCDGARWHSRHHLAINNNDWTENKILLTKDPSMWRLSWSRGEPPAFCLNEVESFGFAFAGFPLGQEPAGIFQLDKFSIERKKKRNLGPA